jgi:hypothetical protein
MTYAFTYEVPITEPPKTMLDIVDAWTAGPP